MYFVHSSTVAPNIPKRLRTNGRSMPWEEIGSMKTARLCREKMLRNGPTRAMDRKKRKIRTKPLSMVHFFFVTVSNSIQFNEQLFDYKYRTVVYRTIKYKKKHILRLVFIYHWGSLWSTRAMRRELCDVQLLILDTTFHWLHLNSGFFYGFLWFSDLFPKKSTVFLKKSTVFRKKSTDSMDFYGFLHVFFCFFPGQSLQLRRLTSRHVFA